MLAAVTVPTQAHHRAWLEEAAQGRCQLVFAPDPRAQIVIGALSPEELHTYHNLNWFHLVWAGVDSYQQQDFPADTQVTNGSGAYGVTIAEHMIAGILALYRQLRHYQTLQAQHLWQPQWQEDTLEGKHILVLGTGDIGRALARRLRGFDCRITGLRRTGGMLPEFDAVYPVTQLDHLLPQADVVACCLPGTPLTRGLLNRTRLEAMKPTALLVNCGRGNLIDTAALETLLAAGRLGGCVLDVTDPEPLSRESLLWDMENVILTPHISGASFGHVAQMEDRIFRLAAENLRRYLNAEPLLNPVDFSAGY